MELEIKKNTIIAILSALLLGAVFYIALLLKMPPDCPEVVEKAYPEGAYLDPVFSDIKLNLLVSETKDLVDERDSLKEANILLKKKVVFYHEYYRVNQPVGMTVAPNDWELPGSWISDYDTTIWQNCGDTLRFFRNSDDMMYFNQFSNDSLTPIVRHHPLQDGDRWMENGDVMIYSDSTIINLSNLRSF